MSTEVVKIQRKVVLLPQEVMDLMIEALALDSHTQTPAGNHSESFMTLAQCLLVSRSFYAKARPLVFRSLVWKEQILPCEKWDEEREKLFFDLFRIRDGGHADSAMLTRLVSHVRSLRLILCFPSTARMVTFDGWSVPQHELDTRREAFPEVLEQMENIEEFALEPGQETSGTRAPTNPGTSTPTSTNNSGSGRKVLNWKTLLQWHQRLKEEIRRVCQKARILRFENISHFPLSLVGACDRNLRTLSLSSISFVHNDLGTTSKYRREGLASFSLPMGLEELEYLSTNEVSSKFFVTILEGRPEAFSKLRQFRITLPSQSGLSEKYVSGERAVLQACASSLKGLEIFSPTSQFSYPPDSVSHLTSLQTLTLRSTITTSLLPESFPPEMMTFFITDLVSANTSSLSPSPLLELTLELHLEAPKIGLNLTDRMQIVPQEWERRWARLDAVLGGPAFPLLERLNVRFLERLKIHKVESEESNVSMIVDAEDAQDSNSKVGKDNEGDSSLKMDYVDWITSLEETSLAWLRRYIEGALPTVSSSSQVEIQLEYRISTIDDQSSRR